MKKTLLFAIIFGALCFSSVRATDVVTLGVTDSIITPLRTYAGNDIVLVIPNGYTNPIYSTTDGTPNSIDLSKLTNLTATTKITIKGDGTMPLVKFKSITLPATLSKIAFRDLTITGATTDPTVNYVVNQAAAYAAVIDSFVVDNCNISTIRSILRFQGTSNSLTAPQGVNHININNSIVRNSADYGPLYCSILTNGPTLGIVKISRSTFYGIGASVFALQSNATSVDISDCTFDNIMNLSAKYLVDLKVLVVPVTITNCILGKTPITTKYLSTGGTLTLTNSYYTTDWAAAAPTASLGITGSLTAYTGASTDLFTSVSVSSGSAGTYATTVGDYHIKDLSFAGKFSAGDPRWYPGTAVNPVLSDQGVSFNGTEITNSKGLTLEVYNVLGKKVASSMTFIPTANFQKGVYIVRASGMNNSLKICI